MHLELPEAIIAWASQLRALGKVLVTTNGVFDLLHAGHVETLEAARARGDALLVLINSDASVQRYKGPSRPFVDAAGRKRLLEALRCVDKVVIFDEDTPLVWLARLQPQLHVKGGSWIPERIAAEATLLETWGGTLELLPLCAGLSTTSLADRIATRAVQEARQAGVQERSGDRQAAGHREELPLREERTFGEETGSTSHPPPPTVRPAGSTETQEHELEAAQGNFLPPSALPESTGLDPTRRDPTWLNPGMPEQSRPGHSRYPWLDLRAIRTLSIKERANLVSLADFAQPAPAGNALSHFLDGLPLTRHRTNTAGSLTEVVRSIWRARALKRGITWGLGPHVVKYGLSLLVADLLEKGLMTAIATNGAGAIHDCELALFGETSEEMTGEIQSGRFGMARETGAFLNEAAGLALRQGLGYGEALGMLLHERGAPHREYSILARAFALGVPVTVHVAIGTDIVHAQPTFSGQATGAASQHDFQILAAAIDRLDEGGVHLNIASSVVLPEVFLKALTVANNLRAAGGRGPVREFMTVAIDHQSEYRPLMNVVRRPTVDVGRGVELLGRVELMLPLLHGLLVGASSHEVS